MRDSGQEEVFQWLCRLEEAAVQNNIKSRLLDAIRDCKKDLESELTEQEWRAKIPELDELSGQIKKQVMPETEEQRLTDDIAKKTSEILEQCKRANKLLQKEYCSGSLTYIQETERSMMELSNVNANYDEVTNEDRFFGVFQDIGKKYKQQMDGHAEKYVSAAGSNYQNAFDRLKNLFAGTGYVDGAERKFYQAYYENQDTLMNDAKEYARSTDKGESSIAECAQELQIPLRQLIDKGKKKAALRKWFPVIVIVVVIVLGAAANVVKKNAETSHMQEQTAEQAGDSGGLLDELVDSIADKAVDTAASAIVESIPKLMMSVVIPILLLLGILYWLWCRSTDKRCRKQIINEVGYFLGDALNKWVQQRKLMPAVEESFEMTGSYMTRQYGGILSQLMQDEEKMTSEKTEIARLLVEWDNIKRKVGV